jgi:hypothetical protein
MNESGQHPEKPSPKQLRYLRDLAYRTGQSFTHPRTGAEASREIDRLLAVERTPAGDRRRELRTIRREMTERRGDASRVDEEIEAEGWGSTATWSTFVEDEEEEEAKERGRIESGRG